jgi:cytoskeletal protein RodZ
MKKILSVFFVAVLALGLLSMVSCSKSSTTSPSPTATPAPVYSQSFDTSVGNWLPDTGVTNAISAAALSTTEFVQGTHSVALTLQMVSGAQAAYVDKTIGGTVNWIGKTVSMHVWIPASMLASSYAFEITVQGGGAAWKTANSWVTSGLTANAWNTLTYVIPAVSTDGTSTPMSGIDSIGFNVQMNGGTAMASTDTLYIDDVEVN